MGQSDRLIRDALLVILSFAASVAHAEGGKIILDARRCAIGAASDPEVPTKIEDVLKAEKAPPKPSEEAKALVRSIEDIVDNQYGPLVAKQKMYGSNWRANWEAIKQELIERAGRLKSQADRYWFIADSARLLMRDAHVSVDIPSTYTRRFPVQFQVVENKTIIGYVDGSFTSKGRRPEVGDEVISINGLSPRTFQNTFSNWTADGNLGASDRIFGLTFGRWSEASGIPVSQLPARYKNLDLVLRSDKGEKYPVKLEGRDEGQTLGAEGGASEPAPAIKGKIRSKFPAASSTNSAISRMRRLGMASIDHTEAGGRRRRFEDHEGIDFKTEGSTGRRMQIGVDDPFFQLPEDFAQFQVPEILQKSQFVASIFNGNSIVAGTFKRNGKRVGYLRIPSYGPENLDGVISALRYTIGRLQKETDYLVFDQTNNPGGYVTYSDLVIKSLVGKYDDNKHMKFSYKPTDGLLNEYRGFRAELLANEGELLTEAEVKGFVTRVDESISKIEKALGPPRANLTDPISLRIHSEYYELKYDRALEQKLAEMEPGTKEAIIALLGVDIFKHQTYTKEVNMMINELDFSGGDATPAGLEDYGRVRLFGMRTSGAGGTVEEFSIRSAVDMILRLTTSLMVRLNGKLVEAYGVHPHVEVPLLVSDIRDDYSTYFERMLIAMDKDRGRTP